MLHFEMAILLCWSKHDLKTSIFMLLSQVYPILIATASSIGSGEISVRCSLCYRRYCFSDLLSISSILHFEMFSAVLTLFFRNLCRLRPLCGTSACFLPFLWLFVNLMTSFYAKAFEYSYLCQGMTLSLWIEFQIAARDLINDIEERGGLGMVSLLGLWIYGIYLVRHRSHIFYEYQIRRRESRRLPTWKRIFLTIWHVPMACW